ncbi:hypothetical protein AB990_01395 [Alkalihalobacillus pseudalcaliphilus]|nr:hypothetical protein AB990_01395 [Alkalihalobacillus pseudalcaliphilus]
MTTLPWYFLSEATNNRSADSNKSVENTGRTHGDDVNKKEDTSLSPIASPVVGIFKMTTTIIKLSDNIKERNLTNIDSPSFSNDKHPSKILIIHHMSPNIVRELVNNLIIFFIFKLYIDFFTKYAILFMRKGSDGHSN